MYAFPRARNTDDQKIIEEKGNIHRLRKCAKIINAYILYSQIYVALMTILAIPDHYHHFDLLAGIRRDVPLCSVALSLVKWLLL